MANIKFDVVTIGAGVMGCSIALEVSKQGLKTAMIDRDRPGQHASYKAGGMLGAQNEFHQDSPLFQLAQSSRKLFPDLQSNLYEMTGINIEYRETGLIKMAHSYEDNKSLVRQFNFLKLFNKEVEALSNDDILKFGGKTIMPNNHFSFYIPGDGQVNANKYTHALTNAAVENGVMRISDTEVLTIHQHEGSYELVTSRGSIFSSKVVLTAGAWTDHLLKTMDIDPCITPVKGEIMLVENPDVQLEHTLFMTNGCYIIPKYKKRFLIGATSKINDDSSMITEAGEKWLWEETTARIPGLGHSKVLMKSSGVRPYAQDGMPLMDKIKDGLFIVSGHYRNGILLSPIIGKLMTEWVVKGICPSEIKDFSIERMKGHAMHD